LGVFLAHWGRTRFHEVFLRNLFDINLSVGNILYSQLVATFPD